MTFVSIAAWTARKTMETPKRPKRDSHGSEPPSRTLCGNRLARHLGPLMDVIRKTPHDYGVGPNLTDYENARARFHWSDVPALCEGMGPGRCNIAYAALDRHAEGSTATRTALRFVADLGWDGAIATRDLSYAELGQHARRFSGALRSLGVNKGRRVFTIMGR